jgi:hypothetical protein
MKRKVILLVLLSAGVIFILLFGAASTFGQIAEPRNINCTICKYENEWNYKFCINCGASLAAMKEAKRAEWQRDREAARRQAVADSLARVREMEADKTAATQTMTMAPRDTTRTALPNVAAAGTQSRALPQTNGTAPALLRPQKPSQQPWHKTMLKEPAILPRLFNVPTADVLGSLDFYFTGGGAFGIEKERNFLGRAGLGLGDIAEVEFATQSVINSLQQGASSLPTSAFKMLLLRERVGLPAIAMALRGTTSWQSLEASSTTTYFFFQTRLTKLYLVASRKVNKVTGHVGIGLTDVRVRNAQGFNFANGLPVNLTNGEELQRNLWAPFGGLSIQANPKTQVMLEIEGLPSYDFAAGQKYGASGIKNIWAGVIGVRFYFANWLAADTGVRYRSDFDGIADSNIQANINLLLPVGRLRRVSQEN